MPFQPAIPLTGYIGWRVFDNTAARQRDVFNNLPTTQRAVEYFKENISSASTAADLVSDRRLLQVALGAFGLGDEIDKRAFVRRILEEGTDRSDSFANRLNDPRWKAFATSFGYGNLAGPSNLLSAFREDIAAKFMERSFEEEVGEVNNDMRLALNFRREIGEIAENASSDTSAWFQILGQPALRELVSTALSIPRAVATIDLDRQLELFQDRAERMFGSKSPKVFLESENVEQMLRQFFVRSEASNGPSALTRGATALSLLNGGGGFSTANLIISNQVF